jgi:multidrug resistance efflux pump
MSNMPECYLEQLKATVADIDTDEICRALDEADCVAHDVLDAISAVTKLISEVERLRAGLAVAEANVKRWRAKVGLLEAENDYEREKLGKAISEVERLRALLVADAVDRLPPDGTLIKTEELDRLKSEVERLRARLGMRANGVAQMMMQRDEARAEVERLREENAALRKELVTLNDCL